MADWEKLLVLHEWDLPKDAVAAFEKAEIGDVLHIDEPIVPLLFEDEENEGGCCIFAFTSEEQIPSEYAHEEYVVANCEPWYILAVMAAVEKALGKKAMLVINPFDDECQEFTREQVEILAKESEL